MHRQLWVHFVLAAALRLFVLVLFNAQCRSIFIVPRDAIHFDCLPLLPRIVAG